MKLRKFLYDVVIPCKRQLLSRLQTKATVPSQPNSNAGHHRQQHTHHYQQQQQPHSIVELVRASRQTRNYSSHAFYGQHQTFAQWQHMMTADALHSAWLKATPKSYTTGSPLLDMIRTRILAIADMCIKGEAMFKSPFSITFQRQNCILTRLSEMRRNAMTATGVPRGYATAIARCQAVPQSAKAAFYTENETRNHDQARFRRRFVRTVKSKQQRQPQCPRVVATTIIDTTTTATVQDSNQACVLPLEQTRILATPAIVEPSTSSNGSDTVVDTLPTNSRYCVAFLLPGPPLYDYLVLDNSNNNNNTNSNSNSSGSHELVSQALALLRERIPRLDVRLEGYEVRVFMPLGTPVATVRHWLHEAGLHEGEQYIFESVSSLRAAAAAAASQRTSQRTSSTSSRLSPIHSHQSSSPLTSQRARDIHAFLVQADALARDTTSFSKLPENIRPRCSPSVRLAAARSYSTALNYVF
ncbi:hypothetical protein BDF22DRAFT_774140 [Syncephalis plumigaleata]|nr:hypothetical protein BDF22DRAFT_774140 [Syncephalis plumigaleata]